MNLQEFIQKYSGKKLDFDGAYQGQCTDLFRYYLKEVLNVPQTPPVVGANDIYDTASDNFERIPNTPDGVPQRGDIVIWNKRAGGGYGHVAVFIEGDANRFTSFDQNWRAINVCEVTEHTYTNVRGWLRLKTMPEKTYTEAEMTAIRLERDANWNKYQEALKKIDELERNIADRARATEEKERIDQDYFDSLVLTLNPDPEEVKGMTTREIVKYEVNKFIDRESGLQKQIKDLGKELERTDGLYKSRIKSFEAQLESAQETIDDLTAELKALKELKPATPTEKPILSHLTGLARLIERIKTVVRRILWLKR